MALNSEQQAREIYQLVRENNKMLHSMRRHAFWGGIFKFVFWTAILLAPIWFYVTYLNTTVEKTLHAIDQVQGTGAQAQVKVSEFENAWKEFESKLPGFMRAPTSTKQ